MIAVAHSMQTKCKVLLHLFQTFINLCVQPGRFPGVLILYVLPEDAGKKSKSLNAFSSRSRRRRASFGSWFATFGFG